MILGIDNLQYELYRLRTLYGNQRTPTGVSDQQTVVYREKREVLSVPCSLHESLPRQLHDSALRCEPHIRGRLQAALACHTRQWQTKGSNISIIIRSYYNEYHTG
jgi:hypothetical protein